MTVVDEQGRRDSNPQPPVLETGALPVELLPSGVGRCRLRYSGHRSAAPSAIGGQRVERRRLQPPGSAVDDGAGGAGRGGGGDAADVGEAAAGEHATGRRGAPRPPRGRRGSRRAARARARAPRCAGCAAPAAACGTAPARPGSAGSARRGGGRRGRRSAVPSATSASSVGDVVTPHRRPPRRRSPGPRPGNTRLAQLAAGPVEPHLGRRLGDAELGGDRLVGQVVDVAEHDDGPQLRRQVARGRPRAGRGAGWRRPGPRGRARGRCRRRRRRRGASSVRRRERLPRWVAAQFAVIRYSQVVNCASPRKRFSPR